MDEFTIEGLEGIQKALTDISNKFPEEKQKELLKLGLMFESEIKPLVPVDQGRLRASINSQVTGDTVETGTDVEYAQDVNDGHPQHARFLPAQYLKNCSNDKGVMLSEKFIEGKHFMEDGFQNLQPKVLPELEDWIQKMLDKIE
ncbi:HK97 gp10 family phage protein [Clostridium estertheticum]|uniref:HK97 gp10 family phage protein n=1 Tax=Clostridium estertheticum TaxID=238834 RepID=UPI00124D3690|nr:HK97 gp10 family phage protein [Clostridium estertheticum]MBZ9615298.1 HK97 gp10 family phage protein [Clostridium estertheticum subsp. laramiense]WAG75187.1 HK97 gp10 family phage protein [Clostridium estertheticum]